MASCTVVSSGGKDPSFVKLRIPFKNDRGNKNLIPRVILVLDRSGSMSGGPWRQVQYAANKILDMTKTGNRDSDLHPIVITYNSTVAVSDLAAVAKMTASGSTDFVKTFAKIQETVKEIGHNKRIVVIFMTDGCDTCNSQNGLVDAQNKLRMFLNQYCSDCVVHVIGYSTGHDLNMMNKLKSLGTTEGFYRYAEGSIGLDDKFRELFEFADTSVDFSLKLPHVDVPIKITGELVDTDMLEAECWLSLTENLNEPIEIFIDNNNKYCVTPTLSEPDTIFYIKSLSRRANEVKTQAELDKIQSELQEVKMFGKSAGESKLVRQQAMELRAELQTRLDGLHSVMGDIARGAINETSALAKLNDLRYADKFSKSSRQRRMDQRAVRNQDSLQLIDKKLAELQFDENTAFNNVDLTTFTCCLTLSNCRDLMLDSRDDIMGVGLVVERQEHVVDAPTLISVKDVSVTILSRSACEDAIKMKMNIVDAAQLHGGFIPSKHSAPSTSTNIGLRQALNQQSEFTRGVAAEPINTFLPLYICDSHFQRIEVMLEPMLGYLFTLDVTGYKSDQLLGLYSILGQMMNASHENESEREELILYEFKHLCQALVPRTRRYLGEGNDILEKFMASPIGRSKAHIQNMMTLFGYIYALDIKNIDQSLRYAIVEELYRRHFSYIYHGTSENIIEEHLEALLYDNDNCENNSTDEQEDSSDNNLRYVKTKNDRSNDRRFAKYAHAVLKLNKKNVTAPTENIVIEYEIPERQISPMNKKVHSKMIELLSKFSTKPIDNVLNRLGIRMMDTENEHECVILRSMLVQCLRFYSNDAINSAVLNKTFFNVETHHEQVLHVAHEELDAFRSKATTNKIEQIRILELARRIVLTDDIGVFLGRMITYAPTRGGKIFDTALSLLLDRSQKQVPDLLRKMTVIFTGRYKECAGAEKEFIVLSEGIAWFPDRSIINRVREALGEDQWDELDQLMRGRTCGHVYRLSDIPNRHGYHNSHPNPKLVVQWSP